MPSVPGSRFAPRLADLATRAIRAVGHAAWMFAAGAACTAPPRSPAQGGPRWFEVTTERFVLRTDLDEDAARAAAREFEADYLYLEQVAFPSRSEAAQRLDVVLFREESEFHRYWPRDKAGFYTDRLPGNLERAPTMVLYGPVQGRARVHFLHELTHRFVSRAYGSAPLWMQEGLAQYFSTMRIEGSRAILGELPDALVRPSLVPTIHELITADRARFYGAWNGEDHDHGHRLRYYAGAYGLVHLLRHGPDSLRSRFDAFVDAMNGGARADVAWGRAFGGIPEAALESAFSEHLSAARHWDLMATPVDPVRNAPPQRVRALADEEVHVLWANLIPLSRDNLEIVRQRLDEAIAQAPKSVLVEYARGCFELTQNRLSEARAVFEAALREDPGNPRVLYALLQTKDRAGDSPDSMVDLVNQLARSARSADELGVLALYASLRGDHETALRRAEQAVEADRTYAKAWAIRARVHLNAGDFASAVTDQERALVLLPEQVDPRPFEKDLDDYRRATASDAAANRVSTSPPLAAGLSRPAAATTWSCPFPPEADTDEIDQAVVMIRVDVDSSGSPTHVAVLDDPGHGFARQARACAMNMQYVPALDREGRPSDGTVRIRVRFSR